MTRCPYCKFRGHWHPGSPRWLHWTPGPMRNVRCNRCGHEFIVWFGLFRLKHDFARPFVKLWNWTLVFAVVLGLSFVLPKVLAQ